LHSSQTETRGGGRPESAKAPDAIATASGSETLADRRPRTVDVRQLDVEEHQIRLERPCL
jgi:hypothetical protein